MATPSGYTCRCGKQHTYGPATLEKFAKGETIVHQCTCGGPPTMLIAGVPDASSEGMRSHSIVPVRPAG